MEDIKALKRKSIKLKLILLGLFIMAFIDNVCEVYFDHFKLSFSMLMVILQLYLISSYSKNLFKQINDNKGVK